MLMNNQTEIPLKEVTGSQFKALPQHFSRGPERNREELLRIRGVWVEI
jgi:hypothetical protein